MGDTETSDVSLGLRESRGAPRQCMILQVMGITVPGLGGLEQVLPSGAPEPTYPCSEDELAMGLLGT